MSLYNPIRGGTRGGRDQFQWEDVRLMTYKDRDQYLGVTVKTGYLDKGGKWRKKDWYTHDKKQQEREDIMNEKKRIQMEDQKRLNKAFGINVQDDDDQVKLNQLELAELTKKHQKDDEEDGLAGLGFALNDQQLKLKNINQAQNFNKLEGEGIPINQQQQLKQQNNGVNNESKKIKKDKAQRKLEKKEKKLKKKEEKRKRKEEKKKRKEEKRKQKEKYIENEKRDHTSHKNHKN